MALNPCLSKWSTYGFFLVLFLKTSVNVFYLHLTTSYILQWFLKLRVDLWSRLAIALVKFFTTSCLKEPWKIKKMWLFRVSANTSALLSVVPLITGTSLLSYHSTRHKPAPPPHIQTLPHFLPFCGQAQRSCYPWATGYHRDGFQHTFLPVSLLSLTAKFWSKWVEKHPAIITWGGPVGTRLRRVFFILHNCCRRQPWLRYLLTLYRSSLNYPSNKQCWARFVIF